MNSPLETGLFLPIRFYDTLTEQDRYKNHAEGVAYLAENYVYVDCKTLAPFQIAMFQIDDEYTISWEFKLICIDTGAETYVDSYTAPATNWEAYHVTAEHLLYLSYLGTADFTGLFGNGRYYIEITVTLDSTPKTYYSDLFVIASCGNEYNIDEFRKTSQSDYDKRLIDATDLRII